MIRNATRAMLLTAWLSFPAGAAATEWWVAPGGSGPGTERAPLGTIQAALVAAAPGDTVLIGAGVYDEAVRTVRDGFADAPITMRAAEGHGPVVIATEGKVLRVDHAFFVVEGLVLDAMYAPDEVIDVSANGHSLILRRVKARRSSRDCVSVGAAADVRIEDSVIHHCLNPAGGRTDAHGIVAGAVRRFTVRRTEIHTFSGDAIQLNREHTSASPGWDDVRIEECRFWLAPLDRAENGFPAGVVPGENAIDTKVSPDSARARISIRHTMAWGFGGGLIRNQAAFNLKENIDAIVDGVTVWDSDIAFRLRGPTRSSPNGAWVRIQNTILHDVSVGVRYENDISNLRVWNTTVGRGVVRPFQAASSRGDGLDVRNVAILGADLPSEAAGPSNLAVGSEAFVDSAAHDYRLTAGSPAVDAGSAIPEVVTDRAGVRRPVGRLHDVGAYEWCPSCSSGPPPAGERAVRP